MSHPGRPVRAPALYVSGWAPTEPAALVSFRVPCPPAWTDRSPGVWAAERRTRKSYFAALDALHSGRVGEEAAAKLTRLRAQMRSPMAAAALGHLQGVLRHVRERRAATPVIPAPASPLDALVISVPPGGDTSPERLQERYAWVLEWLRTRGLVVRRGLVVDWRVLPGATASVSAGARRWEAPDAPDTDPGPYARAAGGLAFR